MGSWITYFFVLKQDDKIEVGKIATHLREDLREGINQVRIDARDLGFFKFVITVFMLWMSFFMGTKDFAKAANIV